MQNYQGNAVINYTEMLIPFTRVIKHQHFAFGMQPHTVISFEYSAEWTTSMEACYPVNDSDNQKRFPQYRQVAEHTPGVIFGGKLGNYAYTDIDRVIRATLDSAAKETD